jgi:hypothetical protein
LGLDLGQTKDPSALSALEFEPFTDTSAAERQALPALQMHLPTYRCIGLKRWKLGTSYLSIVSDLVELFRRYFPHDRVMLVMDETGVGRGVCEMIRSGLGRSGCRGIWTGVTVTGGTSVVPVAGGYHVSKIQLVSTYQVVLQNRRLKVSARLPEAKTLIHEMRTFKIRVTAAANQTFGAEGRDHDDLLFSSMLAVWGAEAVLRPALDQCA